MKTVALCGALLLATVLTAGGAQATTPPTVLLGTAAQFAVLAGSGITNTGASTISGDTGSSATSSETGFAGCPAADCVALTGANHADPNPNDAVTQGAKTALRTAYNDAAGRSPTTVLTELAGQTLVAGVYNSAAGTLGMTGTLTLDGANNADSVFIFQAASTLITGGAANIVFIRGAQPCNVFWQIGSAATLGAGSKFAGTLMAHDDISLGDGVTVSGRLLGGEQASGAGAVTLIHDTITTPSACIQQADLDAAAAAASAAAAQAAAAAAAAQAAADQAAAAAAAAVVAANVEAARVAAVAAAEAARVAQAKADAATAAAATAAKIAAANKAAVKAKAAAKVALAKAAAAKAAAAKAKHAATVAAAALAAKKKKKAAGASSVGHARPAVRAPGFTG